MCKEILVLYQNDMTNHEDVARTFEHELAQHEMLVLQQVALDAVT